jgi:hypothetical protein
MTTLQKTSAASRWGGVAVAAAALLTFEGCNLDKSTIPPLFGPAELALSLLISANPDIVIANDGIDATGQSTIVVNLRDENGAGVPNRGIVFELYNDQGQLSDRGKLSTEVSSTDGNGIAQVTYFAPARSDFTATSSVLVGARPAGSDFNGALFRTTRIEIRSAEPRLFPEDSDNTLPNCNFTVQPFPGPDAGSYPAGAQVLFQSTSSDSDGQIVRYDWDFGDGDGDDKPDVNHAWAVAGLFTVTHTVTDDDGGQQACTFDISIS